MDIEQATTDNPCMENSPDRPRPESLADLFISFTLLALQGFGGVVAVVQRELVERKRWLTQEEFLEEWSVAQSMPGPNVVNMSMMIGARYFGLPGALAAMGGMLLIPLLVALGLASLYGEFSSYPQVAGALRGMAAVAAGLIAATGIKLAAALKNHPLPLPLTLGFALLGLIFMAVLHLPMLATLIGIGGLSCVLTYRRLKP
ncbi:chromate transporter [Pseudoduganella violacea]|uniref:Chromate transporter n=1 Tax=Pseudoduganella violacea TaxID=1715466 RepID=A0A7W5FVG2_9BURK|nr:chromate transporter [Pseudoduganella violacea]MBB3120769.1 chromate transporter [Pseudoduganella violacea]